MTKYLTIIVLTICASCTGLKKDAINIKIIPEPSSVVETGRFMKLNDGAAIYCSDAIASPVIKLFSDQVGSYITVTKTDQPGASIEIKIEPGKEAEAYSLQVNKKKVLLTASTLNGVFYGLQSLRELIIYAEKRNNKLLVPCCSIDDAPCFSWRGLMLDESRHFFGTEKVKQLLDMMALLKLNTFHWHLTDVPGWRIEIKKYPKLTTVGGIGNHNDPEAPAKFYTQDEIKEIVKYAGERFIKIVPEIDMPGHAGASNRAYPEFSGGGSERYPEFTFNPGKDETYSYLTDILREVAGLFPSKYIHLGGDEVSFGTQHWNSDRQVRALMRKYSLPDLKAVEKYFVVRMADSIKSLNRIPAGWDEIIDSDVSPDNTLVMWWRHDRQGQLKKALESKYSVVLCPRIPLYFDFIQYESHKWGRRSRGATCNLETVYNFPPDTLLGYKEHKSQVLGMQANIWTEVIQNNKRLDFMTYPRITALAEAAWTKNENKDYNNFLIRLKPFLTFLKSRDIYYFDPFEPELNAEPAGIK